MPSARGTLWIHEWRSIDEVSNQATLVMLHGFTGSGALWSGVAAMLPGPARVIAPDLPGHGRSRFGDDAHAHRMDAVATALDDALTALGIDSFALCGYSMGGRLALYYVLTRPMRVKRLILESASAGIENPRERANRVLDDEELATFVLEQGIERFVERWEQMPILAAQQRLPQDVRARLREVRLSNSPNGLAASLRGMGVGVQPYLGGRLGEIEVPTLVLAGADDRKFTAIARDSAAAIPDASAKIVPGAGHTPHLENPAAWVENVSRFLAASSRRATEKPSAASTGAESK